MIARRSNRLFAFDQVSCNRPPVVRNLGLANEVLWADESAKWRRRGGDLEGVAWKVGYVLAM